MMFALFGIGFLLGFIAGYYAGDTFSKN